MKAFIIGLFAILFSQFAIGQTDSTGSIEGEIIDKESKQVLMFATVAIYKHNTETLVTGTNTDLDGNYSISNLDTLLYDIEVSYTGYKKVKITKVKISNNEIINQNFELEEGGEEIIYRPHCPPPMIRFDHFNRGRVYTSEDLKNSPIRN